MKSVYPELDMEMTKRGLSYISLAKLLGRSPMSVYRRLRGETQWTLTDVMNVCILFGRYDATTLFLRLDNKQ